MDDEEEDKEGRQKKIQEIREYIQELSKDNGKLGKLMLEILETIIADKNAYRDQNISVILENMRQEAIAVVVSAFARKWFVDEEAVQYAVEFHRNGDIPNENVLKDSINYAKYRESVKEPLPKFKCRSAMITELKEIMEAEIIPLQQR